jgi:hypothetical protein
VGPPSPARNSPAATLTRLSDPDPGNGAIAPVTPGSDADGRGGGLEVLRRQPESLDLV